MIRVGIGVIALIVAVVALGGPAEAASILVAQASAVIALMNEAMILGVIFAGCILLDDKAWPVLTGQKNARSRRARRMGAARSDRDSHPGA